MIYYILWGLIGFVLVFWFSFGLIMLITIPNRRAQKIINDRREKLASLPELEHEDKLWRQDHEPVHISSEGILYRNQFYNTLKENQ